MTTLPVTTFWDTSKTEGEANAGWFQVLLARLKEIGSGESFPTYTISSGVISPAVGFFDVATEGAASSDDLSQISITVGTTWTEGSLIILNANNDAQTVVLKHEAGGSGQLSMSSGADVSLDTNTKYIAFILKGTTWTEVGFVPNIEDGTITAAKLGSDVTQGFYDAYLKYSDVKSTTTAGGTSTSSTTHIRTLNTEDSDTASIGSLSSNQITLPAGTYRVRALCPGVAPGQHRALIYDTTGSSILVLGSSAYSLAASVVSTDALVSGLFTISVESDLELRHFITTGKTGDGLGVAVGDGNNEVYSTIELWRLA